MQIGPSWDERLRQVLEERANESVFADTKFKTIPAIVRNPAFPMISELIGRGVYIEEVCPPDECWYKIVLSTGKVGIVHFPIELCDDALMENLWRRLDATDPVRQLKAI